MVEAASFTLRLAPRQPAKPERAWLILAAPSSEVAVPMTVEPSLMGTVAPASAGPLRLRGSSVSVELYREVFAYIYI